MRLFSLLLVLLALSSILPAQTKYALYRNKRYSFSIEYRTDLLKQRHLSKDTDIGQDFRSHDGKVELVVLASLNENRLTLREIAHLYTYRFFVPASDFESREIAPSEFVMSGTVKKRIYFLKVIRHEFPNADIYYTLFIKYPKSERSKWEPVVGRLSGSFKFDANANVQP